MSHASDRQLVEYYYGDGNGGAVEEHLAACPACQRRFGELRALLDSIEPVPAAEPRPEWEERIWTRLEPRLQPAGFWERWLWKLQPLARVGRMNWKLAAAMAAMLVAGFFAGRYQPTVHPEVAQRPVAPGRQLVRLAALSDHLDRSEFVLLELVNSDARPEADIEFEQQWARELLADNRLLRLAAQNDGDLASAAVLDDLERIFIEIVHEPSTVDATQLEALRHRIEAGETLFRVRWLGRQLRLPEASPSVAVPSGRS